MSGVNIQECVRTRMVNHGREATAPAAQQPCYRRLAPFDSARFLDFNLYKLADDDGRSAPTAITK